MSLEIQESDEFVEDNAALNSLMDEFNTYGYDDSEIFGIDSLSEYSGNERTFSA